MLAKFQGFSLVELLIALLLGSVLLAMVIGLYVTGISTGSRSLKYSRLRSDLQSIMSIMETDIRRAGFGGSEFMVASGGSKTVDSVSNAEQDCIVYYYNHNSSASITDSNKMGIRLVPAENEIQFGTGVDPLADNCYSSGTWTALSDKQFIKITVLEFSESSVSNAAATLRSVSIDLTGELVSDSSFTHSISTTVQVRNLEFN
ncbi:prepilin-type N-terminal cleavage/methylation domain-containing protein [Psychromonas aquimarina]|uniref:prepilin-type N-terminal cleavage/methylation domain-containing protein n=1 Tax=Psychromonas aquimarina TaxID=444919 RepID=UPI0003FBFBDA|nr:prepilin-type N-terminal cleavage/methylation domain-containing protein [Psychromonas aquimarina]